MTSPSGGPIGVDPTTRSGERDITATHRKTR